MSEAEFDRFATDYRQVLDKTLAVSGENASYFASGRLAWLRRVLGAEADAVARLLDFGCGPGHVTPFLLESFPSAALIGMDVSAKSIAEAAAQYGGPRARFVTPEEWASGERVDLAHCNGVFHHIPVADRPGALRVIREALREGGRFALFENNALNPVVRWAMDRCPFDTDAIPIRPGEAVRMVREAGFVVERVDHLFFFPRPLAFLRPIEPAFHKIPMGGQYLVLARR